MLESFFPLRIRCRQLETPFETLYGTRVLHGISLACVVFPETALTRKQLRKQLVPGFFSQLWGRYFCCVATTKAGGVGMEDRGSGQHETTIENQEPPESQRHVLCSLATCR